MRGIARALLGVLICVLPIGCGGPGEEAPDPAPAAELEAIPRPDLGGFSEAARSQLEAELVALDHGLAGEGDASELGERFGRIGRIYHAYGLLDPARSAYGNAERLLPEDHRWPYLLAVIDASRGAAESAEPRLRRALDLEPDHAAATLRLAELLLSQNRWAEAEPLYENLYSEAREADAALYGLARVAAESGDHELAIERYERLLERAPGAGTIYYLMGLSFRQLGDEERAEAYIARRGSEQVSFADPLVEGLKDLVTGVGTPIERALAAYGDKDYAAAVEFYTEALTIEPDHATALRGRALAQREAGNIESSSADFERMLELYPDHQLARLDYGTALLEAGELDRAVEQLEEAVERDPSFKEARFNLGVAFTRAGRWSEAAESFGAVVAIDPRNVSARYHQGMALAEAGDGVAAIAALESTLEEAPNHVPARQRLALVREQVEGADAARETLLELVGAADVPDQERALALFQLGRLATEAGDTNGALEHYRRAVDLFPELWQARYNLANALALEGELEGAAVELATAISRDPENVLLRVRESEILRDLGEHGIARARLEEGLAEAPRSAELGHALARVLAVAPQAAVRDGARALELAQGIFSAAPSIEHGETVAMALAELGRFDEAIHWQEQVLAKAEEADAEVEVERLRRGLETLRRGVPLRDEEDRAAGGSP